MDWRVFLRQSIPSANCFKSGQNTNSTCSRHQLVRRAAALQESAPAGQALCAYANFLRKFAFGKARSMQGLCPCNPPEGSALWTPARGDNLPWTP